MSDLLAKHREEVTAQGRVHEQEMKSLVEKNYDVVQVSHVTQKGGISYDFILMQEKKVP